MAKINFAFDHIIFTASHTHCFCSKAKSNIPPSAAPHLISVRQSQLMTDWWVVTYSKNKVVASHCHIPVPAFL